MRPGPSERQIPAMRADTCAACVLIRGRGFPLYTGRWCMRATGHTSKVLRKAGAAGAEGTVAVKAHKERSSIYEAGAHSPARPACMLQQSNMQSCVRCVCTAASAAATLHSGVNGAACVLTYRNLIAQASQRTVCAFTNLQLTNRRPPPLQMPAALTCLAGSTFPVAVSPAALPQA
eukprot:CAMPEP_0205874490 /NCGR_PEP_ID=MMETSP1083-20121108/12739_1 /ASSEMBLY_ACC=CAM_ASM_000430 /TAXON_ID=97485 /ORGANISM="Prymnesium parvum, Strain Texoma1" /LENGTH=175 /DNA_ID=CAMNT_0053237081 /DNA_START=236 /DNA_END=764 /DNA_ORIENTATION=-